MEDTELQELKVDSPVVMSVDYKEELLTKARQFRFDGKPQESVKLYNEILSADSSCYNAHLGLGRSLKDLGRYAEALESQNAAIELSPNEWDAILERASCNYMLKHHKLVIADTRSAISEGKGGVLAYILHCRSSLEIDNPIEALQAASEVSRMSGPGSIEGHLLLAHILSTHTDNSKRSGEGALIQAKLALRKSRTEDSRVSTAMAMSFAELGQFGEAVSWQKKAIDQLPMNAPASIFAQFEDHLELYMDNRPLRMNGISW
jgi:tetratricopeptide (TPR) repeat protein